MEWHVCNGGDVQQQARGASHEKPKMWAEALANFFEAVAVRQHETKS